MKPIYETVAKIEEQVRTQVLKVQQDVNLKVNSNMTNFPTNVEGFKQKTNFLQGNYSKYQARAIARDTQQMELVIDDCRINFTDAFKLLGIIIDKDLNFSQLISEVCIKTSKVIGVLQRLKNLIPMNGINNSLVARKQILTLLLF